jgi:hypothetical protein
MLDAPSGPGSLPGSERRHRRDPRKLRTSRPARAGRVPHWPVSDSAWSNLLSKETIRPGVTRLSLTAIGSGQRKPDRTESIEAAVHQKSYGDT